MTNKKQEVYCTNCGSADGFVADASATWDVESQSWEIDEIWEKGGFCNSCDQMDARFDYREVQDEAVPDPSKD